VFLTVSLAAALLTICGCGMFGGGVSDFERQRQSQEGCIELLKEQGAKFEQKTYTQGVAWAIDLSGMDITDQTLELLGKVGRITELNFTGSSISDDQLAELNDNVEVTAVLRKLDLSKTGITDAGIAAMTKYGFLADLNLTGTEVTAAAIDSFKKARTENPEIMPMMKNVNVAR
jgi:hypothetical protein